MSCHKMKAFFVDDLEVFISSDLEVLELKRGGYADDKVPCAKLDIILSNIKIRITHKFK